MSSSSVYNQIKFPFLEIINVPAIVITSFRMVPCHSAHVKKGGSLKWYLLCGLGQVGLGRQHSGSQRPDALQGGGGEEWGASVGLAGPSGTQASGCG